MALGLFLLCSIIWGLTWISIKFQFGAADPNAAVFYRFLVSALIMWVLCGFKKINLGFTKKDHLNFVGQGFFMFCLNYQLTYWASMHAPSAIVALAFTMLIYFNMFGARIFFSQKVEGKVFWGAALSIFGLGIMFFAERSHFSADQKIAFGFFLSLIATISASAGNLVSSLSRQRKINIFANNTWGMFYGALFSFIFCVFTTRSFHVQISTDFLWSFIYLTVFGTVISFAAYLKLIELLGPAKAAFTSVISPALAVIVSAAFENLPITAPIVAGVAVCLIGNTIALAPKNWLRLKFR